MKLYSAFFFLMLSLQIVAQTKPNWAVKLDSISNEKDFNKKKYAWFEIRKDITETWKSNDLVQLQAMSDKISTLKVDDEISLAAWATEMPAGNLQLEWLIKEKSTGEEAIWHFSNNAEIKPGTFSGQLKLEFNENADLASYGVSIYSGKIEVCHVEDIVTKCLFERLYTQNIDEDKDSINQILLKRLHSLWANPSLYISELKGLDRMMTILSDDKKVKVSTYGLIKQGFKNEFYGAVITNEKGEVTVFDLVDQSEDIRSPERSTLTDKKWYGAIYIDLVQNSYKNKTYYTLLGYKGQDEFVKTRVVDVLSVSNNRLRFGSPIFKVGRYTNNRLIYKYSVDATMLLRYDAKAKMIVMDHLAPSEPFYQGIYRFYGPDFSYCGLQFNKGVWELHEEIDIRNPKAE